ncbi:TniQ family protein [Curtobacterium sp. MCBA15_013]|uniref:TniQ family protein n=1 Tax=Curtobacterium sp. MCBA15_013 TaxID=1898739 RepID=UPI0009F1FF53|nr:TniQ family protein [Curtobacterium sp. MCBA15_013]
MTLHLPIVVWPEDGESFQSWIRRYCCRLRVSPSVLYKAFGLTSRETSLVATSHGFGLPAAITLKLTIATGIPGEVLRDTTFDRYERVPSLEFDQVHRVRRLRGWIKGTHTRFCMQCLAESGGVFQLKWQLGWTFACVQHSATLTDWCWSCKGPVSVAPPRLQKSPRPFVCYRHLNQKKDAPRVLCKADITAGTFEPLTRQNPIIDAQIFVDALFEQHNSPEAAANISDLRATCVGLLDIRDRSALERGAGLPPGSLAGLEPETSRTGAVVPGDALFFGALVTAAKALMIGDDAEIYSELRELLYGGGAHSSPLRVRAWWKDGPSELIENFGGSDFTKRRAAHAMNRDLTARQRISFGTALPPSGVVTNSDAELPESLWDEWLFALDPGGRHTPDAIRRTLNMTLRSYGQARTPRRAQPAQGRPSVRGGGIGMVGQVLITNEDGEGDFIEAIARLIEYAGTHPPQLDYRSRRRLIDPTNQNFLPKLHWEALAHSVGASAALTRQYEMARAFMFERVTGSDYPRRLIADLHDGKRTRPVMSNFILLLTSEVLAQMDRYLAAVLEASGHPAPVREMPPVTLLPGRLRLRGTIDDVDLTQLHAAVLDGQRSLKSLASVARIRPRDVALVLASHPPRAQISEGPSVDWQQIRTDL